MKSFNLTECALSHRAVVLFLILLVTVAGTLGFGRLGQLEDPHFSMPHLTAMVVWPGATAQQLRMKCSTAWKKFEQLDHFERSRPSPARGFRRHADRRQGGTSQGGSAGGLVSRRARVPTISSSSCRRRRGPHLQATEFGDVYGLMCTPSKGTGSASRISPIRRAIIKRRLLKVPMVKKVDLLGKQAEESTSKFLPRAPGGAGHPTRADHGGPEEPECRPAVRLPRHRLRPDHVRIGGQFRSLDDIPQPTHLPQAGASSSSATSPRCAAAVEDPQTYSIATTASGC